MRLLYRMPHKVFFRYFISFQKWRANDFSFNYLPQTGIWYINPSFIGFNSQASIKRSWANCDENFQETYIWVRIFRKGPSKLCGRQLLKNLKGCFPQILLEYLNTLSILEYLDPYSLVIKSIHKITFYKPSLIRLWMRIWMSFSCAINTTKIGNQWLVDLRTWMARHLRQ